MNFQIHKITANNKNDWDNNLLLFNDKNIYQTFGYNCFSENEKKNLYTMLLIDNGKPVCMAIGKTVSLNFLKTGFLVIRGGPVFNSSENYEKNLSQLKSFLESTKKYMQSKFIFWYINISISEKTNPLLEVALREIGFTRPIFERAPNLSNIVRIYKTHEENVNLFESKWRNQMRRAETIDTDTEWGNSEKLIKRYCNLHNSMCLIKKIPGFVLDYRKLLLVSNALNEKIKILLISDKNVDICGCVIGIIGDRAFYLYAASSEQARKNYISNKLISILFKQLRNENISEIDLVGIDPKNNWGSYHFKRGIGGITILTGGEWELANIKILKTTLNFFLLQKTKRLFNF